MWLYSPPAHKCTGWMKSHCIPTEYVFTITQHSSCCCHSTFPSEDDKKNDHHSLVCHSQQYETTLKTDLKVWLYCTIFMSKLLDVEMHRCYDSRHALGDKYPSARCCAKDFFAVTNVPPSQCMCQKCVLVKVISISCRRQNMVHHMWWYRQV